MAKSKSVKFASKKSLNNTDAQDKKKRIIAWIGLIAISLFIIFLMFGSLFEAALYKNNPDSTNQMKYGKYEFTYRDLGDGAGVLVTNINDQEVEFQNLPTQVGYLNVSPQAIELLKNAQTVILTADMSQNTSDPLSASNAGMIDYARLQMGLALGKIMNAMLYDDLNYKLPVINCSKASAQMVVVQFNTSNETNVVADGYCITINAQQRDLMRVKDRIIFEYYGLLDNGNVTDN